MSSQIPPTYPGPMPQDTTFHQPFQQEQHYYPEQDKLSPQPPHPTGQREIHPLLRNWPWIFAIIAALMIGYGLGDYIGLSTPPAVVVQPEATVQATPAPANPTQAIPTSVPTTPPQIIQPTPATDNPTQVTPTSAATTQSQWVTTQTFTANGSMKTGNFTVPDEWKMQWTCNPASSDLGQYNVIVAVYNADGTPLDPGAFNTICKAGVTSGSTQEHQGGNVYLDIETEGNVTFTVQEFK